MRRARRANPTPPAAATPGGSRAAPPAATAAEAALAQVRDREAQVRQAGDAVDAEEATLTYLAELRAALAGEVTEHANVEAVRAALLRIFERFTLHRASAIDLDALADDD